jgi:hypothetical protein
MPRLASIRHEKFARFVADGLTSSEAYRRTVGVTARNADVNASQWLNKRGVRARVDEIRRENDRKSVLSREQALKFLSDVIQTPAGQIDKDHPLCQS